MNHRRLFILFSILVVLALGAVVTRAQEVDCDIVWHTVEFGTILDQGTDFVTLEAEFNSDLSRYDAQIETDGDSICRIWSNTDEYSVGGPTLTGFGDVNCGDPQFGEGGFGINFVVSTGDNLNSFYLADPSPFTITINFEPQDGCAPPGGDYTRPYRTSDESSVFDGNGWDLPGWLADFGVDFVLPEPPSQVYALSLAPGAPVMAAEDGTVELRPLSAGDCILDFHTLTGMDCIFVTGSPDEEILDVFSFTTTDDTWLVTLHGDDGKDFDYVVSNADFYISNDLAVHAGCVIGESVEYQGATPSEITSVYSNSYSIITGATSADFRSGDPAGQGVSLIRFHDNDPDILSPFVDEVVSQLSVYNEDANPCNLTPGLQDCLNHNPEFRRNGEGWTAVGSMTFGPNAVILDSGASLEQQLNLDSETAYTMVISASWFVDSDIAHPIARQFRARLGTTNSDFIVPISDELADYTIPSATVTPDIGDTFSTARVTNTGPYALLVASACVSSADVHTTPQACYFADPTFDNYGTGWTSGGSGVTLFFQGWAQVPDGGWISQPVALEPNEDDSPRTYNLIVEAHALGYNGSDSGTASLSYTWPADSGSPVSIGTLDLNYDLPGNPGYPDGSQSFTAEVVVSSSTSGDFHINVTSDVESVPNIAIDSVCLEAEGGNGVGGPPTPLCSTNAKPQNNDIGPWITWHWNNLNGFFKCDLMVLLRKMYTVSVNTYNTVGYWIKYSFALIRLTFTWSDKTFFPWLNGHFRNMAIGQVTTITESGGGCHDIFCAIGDLIGGLNPIIDALANAINNLVAILLSGASFFFTILGGVITFILALIVKLFVFIQSAAALLGGLITAYNTATPTAIPGLPTCASDPDSSILCRGLWVLDNTIFAGRWGILFTVILSILGIHLILWAMGEFRNIILKMGSAT